MQRSNCKNVSNLLSFEYTLVNMLIVSWRCRYAFSLGSGTAFPLTCLRFKLALRLRGIFGLRRLGLHGDRRGLRESSPVCSSQYRGHPAMPGHHVVERLVSPMFFNGFWGSFALTASVLACVSGLHRASITGAPRCSWPN